MKTKLGINVTMMAAATYLFALFGGYVALLLIAGYVLLCETDEWLKKSAVKALVVSLAISVVSVVIGFIPDAMSMIDSLVGIFGGHFSIGFIYSFISLISTALAVLEKLLFLGLAFMATSNKTIKLPFVDELIDKNM